MVTRDARKSIETSRFKVYKYIGLAIAQASARGCSMASIMIAPVKNHGASTLEVGQQPKLSAQVGTKLGAPRSPTDALS